MKPTLTFLGILAVLAIDHGSGLKCYICKGCFKVNKNNVQTSSCKSDERCVTQTNWRPSIATPKVGVCTKIERSCVKSNVNANPVCATHWNQFDPYNLEKEQKCWCNVDLCNDMEPHCPKPPADDPSQDHVEVVYGAAAGPGAAESLYSSSGPSIDPYIYYDLYFTFFLFIHFIN